MGTAYVRLFGAVDHDAVQRLLETVDQKLAAGADHLVLLLSTPGGKVFDGLSAYNYLRGLPLTITTHNFGSCDSVGVVLFCAGQRRFTVPDARFVLHTPYFELEDETLGERQLGERLAKLRVDARNMASVIARETGHAYDDTLRAMRERTVLDAEQAVQFGLVHELRRDLVPPQAEVAEVRLHAPEEDSPLSPKVVAER